MGLAVVAQSPSPASPHPASIPLTPVSRSTDDPRDLELSPLDATGPAARAAFRAHGVGIVRGLLTDDEALTRYRDDLWTLIIQCAANAGLVVSSHDLDAAFNALCAHDRDLGGRMYEAARSLESYYPLVSHAKVAGVAKALLGAKTLFCPYALSMVRLDRPGEPWYALDWHQDYPYNMMGETTVTAWAPLTDVSADMGPVTFVPGSHRHLNAYRLAKRPARGGGVSESVKLTVADHAPEDMEAAAMAPCVSAGDVVFFHHMLLHRSGENRSDRHGPDADTGGRTRFIVNHRYGDAACPLLAQRGWRTGLSHDLALFRSLHPDRVALDDASA